MGRVNLDDVRPGMVLAGDVKAASDRLLLGAATELTEQHLRIFRMWGVTEVDVRGVTREEIAEKLVAQLTPAVVRDVEARVRQLFRLTDPAHPVVQEMVRLTTDRLLRSATSGGARGA